MAGDVPAVKTAEFLGILLVLPLTAFAQSESDEGRLAAEILGKYFKDAKQLELTIKQPLADLFYDVSLFSPDGVEDKIFQGSVKELQLKLREPATGRLTLSQFRKAEAYADALRGPRTEFVQGVAPIVTNDVLGEVVTQGTMQIDGEDIAWPINQVMGRASRTAGTYKEIFQYLDIKNNWVFSMAEDTYQILTWTDDEIVAKKSYTARVTKVVIDLKAKTVTYLTEDNKDGSNSAGGFPKLESLTKTRVSRLAPSGDAARAYYEKLAQRARDYVANRARNALGLDSIRQVK